MKKIKAYLIDPIKCKVTEVEINKHNLQDIYDLIDSKSFDVAHITNGDGIYVDDEGLINDKWFNYFGRKASFLCSLYHSLLVGKGLVIGCDDDGDASSPTNSFETIKASIIFI